MGSEAEEIPSIERQINTLLNGNAEHVGINWEDVEYFEDFVEGAAQDIHRGDLPTLPPRRLSKIYRERMDEVDPDNEVNRKFYARSLFASLGLAIGKKSGELGRVGKELSYWSSGIPYFTAIYDDSFPLKIWEVYGASTSECLDIFEASKEVGEELLDC